MTTPAVTRKRKYPKHIPGPGEPGSWRWLADNVLRDLFAKCVDARPPTKQEIYDAYPFGMRKYTPYKVWCEQVRWWQAGCPQYGRKRPDPVLPGQGGLL